MPGVDPSIFCPECGGIKKADKDVCNWCSGEPISLGTYVEVETFNKVKAQLQAAQEKLVVAEGLLKWVMSPDFYSISRLRRDIPIQTFLSTSQVSGLVVVKADFLDRVVKLSVELYDLAGKLDLFATREEALKVNEEVHRLKDALEGKKDRK